ncbi:MAG: hypothetical protein CMO74_00355 [Verrucomicrobiales bacterium]|nr:hypothetical protein [Verrucomicrobiales bacterium]
MQEDLQKIRANGEVDDPFDGALLTKKSGMKLHFYGEAKYNWTKGSNGNYFDPHRFVMMPSYQINDWIYFNSELEIEHGGVDDKDNSRWRGAVELEQMYADVKVNDWLNWRSLGVSLIPVGTINLYHEPDLFYSVHRPIMYKYVIPSTWMEGSTGLFGDVPGVEGLSYMYLISQGLSSADAQIDDSKGTRNARPNMYAKGDNRQLAHSFRLAYDGSGAETEWLKGFAGSVSTYLGNYQENTTSDTSAILWDVEASYRFQKGALKNLELIADYAQWHFGDPSAIADVNVGENQYGYRLEAAYHYGFGSGGRKLVPFFRYEGYDLSDDGAGKAGFVESGSKNYLTYGAALFLDPAFVVKAAVRQSLDAASSSEFSLGVGYHF